MRSLLTPAAALCLCVVSLNQSAWAAEPQAGTADNPPTVKTLNTPREFPEDRIPQAMAGAGQRDSRACAGELRPVAAAGEDPPPGAYLRQGRTRRLQLSRRSISRRCPASISGVTCIARSVTASGPFPAILNPHGHWKEGRLGESKDGCTAGRCISFARQGMIAFSYDMVGYNDTFFADYAGSTPQNRYQRHHSFATSRDNLLWNISLMGLQTWDSIRALDFIASLPGRGHQAAGLHRGIRRRHTDLHARLGGGPAGGASPGRDGFAHDARRLPVRKRAWPARGILEHGNRRRRRAAPANPGRRDR